MDAKELRKQREEDKKWMSYLYNNNSCVVSEISARGWPNDPEEYYRRITEVIAAVRRRGTYAAGSTAEGVDPKRHYAVEGRPRAEYTHLIWAVAQVREQKNYLEALKKAGFEEVTRFSSQRLAFLFYKIS